MRRIFRSVSLVYLSATTRNPSTAGAEFQKSVFIDKLESSPAQIRSTDFASKWQIGIPPRYTPALSMLLDMLPSTSTFDDLDSMVA